MKSDFGIKWQKESVQHTIDQWKSGQVIEFEVAVVCVCVCVCVSLFA